MKKTTVTAAVSLVLTISIGVSAASATRLNTRETVPSASASSVNENEVTDQSRNVVLKEKTASQESTNPKADVNSSAEVNNSKSSESNKNAAAVKTETKSAKSLSRGGNPFPAQDNTYSDSPVNSSTNSKFGELLAWSKVNSIIPIGSLIQVKDLSTGITFNIKRTFGTNHIDGEAPTLADTNIIKSIWGGFTWARRPVIVSFNGRKIAASMSAMPHAGVDSAPAVQTVSNRSDGYGTGENLDAVKNNGMSGVIDIHFLNSTRHKDNRPDPQHQAAILRAAGK